MNNRNSPAAPQNGLLDDSGTFMDSEDMGGPGLTKLEKLAMDIYLVGIKMAHGPVSTDELASGAFERANAFFDYQDKVSEK